MSDLGVDLERVRTWFPHESEVPYVLVRVSDEHAQGWAEALGIAVRRCYVTDAILSQSAAAREVAQLDIIAAKLPDAGSTMAGDFGEILVYLYQGAQQLPRLAIGATKWRLKQDRTKPAPHSDVVHLVIPSWPTPSADDLIVCSEVKTKSTNGPSTPIASAIEDSLKDLGDIKLEPCAPWGAELEGREWRHVPPKAWGRMVPSWRDAGAGAMLARYSPADSERAD